MERSAEILARFAFAEGVTGDFSGTIEVSLDCCVCRRCRRTIRFEEGRDATCIKTGHVFPGKLLAVEVTRDGSGISARYRISYPFESFVDAEDPEDLPSGQPTWARVRFTAVCPKCRRENRQSTQNNLVRPFTAYCLCGFALFTERDEMPMFRI